MRPDADGGMGRRTYVGWLVAIGLLVAAQSVVHLEVVLGRHDLHSDFDLDRSNGVPDLVSTGILATATVGAFVLAALERGARRIAPAFAGGVLAALTLADFFHDGAHPSRPGGVLVVALVVGTFGALTVIASQGSTRNRFAIAVAAGLLAASFLASGLDRFDQWFERRRGDPVAEYRIVAKEGLELAGWALVALALADEALRARASRAPAPSRRRAA